MTDETRQEIAILNSIPDEVRWEDIVQFQQLNERVAVANDVCANIVGVNEGSIEWCPNDEPPSMLETFLWWWVVRPDLGDAIALEAPPEYFYDNIKISTFALINNRNLHTDGRIT